MKRFYKDFRLAIIVAVIVFGVSWMIGNTYAEKSAAYQKHLGLHDQLGITNEQHKELVPIESRFALKKQNLQNQIDEANKELALAIKEEESFSPKVAAAIDKIHIAYGELQKATIEHLFEMRTVLSAAQKKKLNDLTTNALTSH